MDILRRVLRAILVAGVCAQLSQLGVFGVQGLGFRV